jgi:hypothetical protein
MPSWRDRNERRLLEEPHRNLSMMLQTMYLDGKKLATEVQDVQGLVGSIYPFYSTAELLMIELDLHKNCPVKLEKTYKEIVKLNAEAGMHILRQRQGGGIFSAKELRSMLRNVV